MFKRFMNSLTLFAVLWSVFFVIVGTYEMIIESREFGEYFEFLIITICVYFFIGLLNYIFFNKITLWHKQPKD